MIDFYRVTMSGTLLITLGKTFLSLFPFLRELFLGDPRGVPKSGKRHTKERTLLKKTLIAIGLSGCLMCVYLVYQLWTVSAKYHALTKEVAATQSAASKPPAAPAPKASEPDPIPLIDKDPPSAGIKRRARLVTLSGDDQQAQRLQDIQRTGP